MARHSRLGKKAKKAKYEEGLKRLEALERLALFLLLDAEEDNEEEEFCAAAVTALAIQEADRLKEESRSGKYGARGPYDQAKSEDFFDTMLLRSSDRTFRSWFRMGRDNFWTVHDLICDDKAFQSKGRKPQRPVKYQLATFLVRVGAETAVKTAAIMSIAEGTVFLYSKRVCSALRRLRPQFLTWPMTDEAREEMSGAIFSKWAFPGCLGSADGSLFRLADRPLINPFAYWCRKKFYAIVIQATVDYRGRFTSYELGWPGSVQDSRIFRESDLWRNRTQFFRPHEYIIVDKGYPLTWFSIRPFSDQDLTTSPAESGDRKKWNQHLSSLRIFVEHAFGRLKGRFPYLQCIPSNNLRETFRTIEALLVLHNILESHNDDASSIPNYNPNANRADQDDYHDINTRAQDIESSDLLHRQGIQRRKELVVYYKTRY